MSTFTLDGVKITFTGFSNVETPQAGIQLHLLVMEILLLQLIHHQLSTGLMPEEML